MISRQFPLSQIPKLSAASPPRAKQNDMFGEAGEKERVFFKLIMVEISPFWKKRWPKAPGLFTTGKAKTLTLACLVWTDLCYIRPTSLEQSWSMSLTWISCHFPRSQKVHLYLSQPYLLGKRQFGSACPVSTWFSPNLESFRTSLVAQTVKHLLTKWETQVWSLGWEDLLEKETATHSSTLAWKIPWTEDPGRLQSMRSPRVGYDWVTSLSLESLLGTWWSDCVNTRVAVVYNK